MRTASPRDAAARPVRERTARRSWSGTRPGVLPQLGERVRAHSRDKPINCDFRMATAPHGSKEGRGSCRIWGRLQNAWERHRVGLRSVLRVFARLAATNRV
jgi:hypothetical protein